MVSYALKYKPTIIELILIIFEMKWKVWVSFSEQIKQCTFVYFEFLDQTKYYMIKKRGGLVLTISN